MIQNNIYLFFLIYFLQLCKPKASQTYSESGSQENLTTSQRIGDDFPIAAQSIHEVDESKEDGSDEKKTNNDDGSAISDTTKGNGGDIQTNNETSTAEPLSRVLRSQSQYSMPVTNG